MQRTNTLELDSTLFFNISVNTNVLVFLEKKKISHIHPVPLLSLMALKTIVFVKTFCLQVIETHFR